MSVAASATSDAEVGQLPGETWPDYYARTHPLPEPPHVRVNFAELLAGPRSRSTVVPMPTTSRSIPAAYVRRAFEEEVQTVRTAVEGTRNDTLNVSAFALGQLVGAGVLDRGLAEDALREAARASGLPPGEVETTLRSGIEAGVRQPRANLPERATSPPGVDPVTGEVVPSATLPDVAEVDAVRERFPRLDLGALVRAERKPREFVVAGLIPVGASVSVVAPAGSMKSLLMLALSVCVARGDRTFAGLPLTPRRVLYVDMENTEDDLAERLRALGVENDLDDLTFLHLPALAALDTPHGGTELGRVCKAYGMRAGDLVVLDSLQRVIEGGENDSDTLRAYYRHTAVMLKRRGLTVIRTDNTGKDADKGARGTSGKRDDVDVELILTRDTGRASRLRLRPGKVRLPGIEPLLIDVETDDDGRLRFGTGADPFRARVVEICLLLDDLDVRLDAGERKAADAVKARGLKVARNVLRAAVKERRDAVRTAP